MNVQKFIFALTVLFALGLSTSCSKSNLEEDEALYNATEQQAIDGKEIKNQDT
ncbi:hypothetical protein [Flagellimonas onchidii]|uniref:hypothetical protein n=1 Tax=Flagellimonas onchidii TaxID=2562684 RepID=UPI001456005B|nr:hypothetical protein [Allomuricauda onchidii]